MIKTYTETEVLDAIAKLCKEQKKNVYKHLVRYEDENIGSTDFYSPECDKSMKIPRCHKVVYCDVLLQ